MKLYDLIDAKCAATPENCTVHFQDLVDFDFDRVVFIRKQAVHTEVAAELNMEVPEMGEFDEAIIFLLEAKIVMMDKRTYHPEQPYTQTAFLDFGSDKSKYVVVGKKEAIFKAKLSEGKNYRNYSLIK